MINQRAQVKKGLKALWACNAFIGRTWNFRPTKITYAAVPLWDRMDIALARSELEPLRRAACIMITGAMGTTPIKVLEMFLDLPTLGMTVESAALMAIYHLPWPNPKNLEIGHNRIWAKTDTVNSKVSMIKDHVTLRRTFGKYRIAISTREEWEKNGSKQLRKGHVWFTVGVHNKQGSEARVCKYQNKIRRHISLGQDATVFRGEVMAILDGVTSCLRKETGEGADYSQH